MSNNIGSRWVWTLIAIACSGCGGETYSLAKVAGKVTKIGNPVEGASVLFQPIANSASGIAGPGSVGITDANGHFELKTYKDSAKGAVVGMHRVTITLPLPPGIRDDGYVDPSLMSPTRFRDGSMQFEVPTNGLESVNFELNEK